MRRRGFTIIELLLVISVILVLVTMLFVAYGHIVSQRHATDTRTAMETAKTLLSNYEQATHFSIAPPNVVAPVGGPAYILPKPPAAQFAPSFWITGFTPSGEFAPSGPFAAQTTDQIKLAMQGTMLGGVPIVFSQQLVDTLGVMYAVQSIPDNEAILNSLPTGKVLMIPVLIYNWTTPDSSTPANIPLLLDGWGNPILFVPGDGLYGVQTSVPATFNSSQKYNQGDQVIYQSTSTPTTTCFYTWNNTTPGSTAPISPYPQTATVGDPNWGGLCAPAFRPYWISGGPDGDISNAHGGSTTGHDDDNIYSFNN